ncbi:MAG: LD-carboxypeptidase [Firmicutes bacterium]|nr:LD-carboxypeptidase [Bacillota bacterium]MCL5040094.1 LD-carboxypeptidase [Bacillota bacterium]
MRRIKPTALRSGGTIAVVAPASPVTPDRIEFGLEWLKQQGYQVVSGQHLFDRRGYLAGDDRDRAADLMEMFARRDVDAIFCARGGYGTPRLLDRLDYGLIKRNPKVFLGYSDITGLHLAIQRRTGLVTFHGPMVEADPRVGFIEYNWQGVLKAVTDPRPIGGIQNPPGGPPLRVVAGGKARGRLVGGNLSLISATLGTPYEIDTRARILFLEDVGEAPYRMDRMLNHLLLAGKLQEASGIIIGESVGCEKAAGDRPSLTLLEILEDLLAGLGKPVISGLVVGHGYYKASLPLGVEAVLDADAGSLEVVEAALAPGPGDLA